MGAINRNGAPADPLELLFIARVEARLLEVQSCVESCMAFAIIIFMSIQKFINISGRAEKRIMKVHSPGSVFGIDFIHPSRYAKQR